jgi:hypothetical protein
MAEGFCHNGQSTLVNVASMFYQYCCTIRLDARRLSCSSYTRDIQTAMLLLHVVAKLHS